MKTEVVNGVIFNSDMTELIKVTAECKLPNGKFITPSSVKRVHGKAFENCDVKEIDFSNTEIIGDDACFNCQKLKSVYFGTAIKISPIALSYCESVENITLNKANRKYKCIDGVLFEGTKLFLFPSGRKGSYTAPEGTTEIGEYAFRFSQLSEITLPDTLTEIKESAFEGSKLKKINFSKSTSLKIGYRAFSACEDLIEISLTDGSVIDDYAFAICSSLSKVNYNPNCLKIGKNIFQHTPFYDSFYDGLTVTDFNADNIEEMSTEELERLISGIEGTPCKIMTPDDIDEFMADIKVTPDGTMLFPHKC